MKDPLRRSSICKMLAILVLPLVFGTGCSLDKGSSGDIPPVNVFLEAEGCLVDDPDQDQVDTISFSMTIPFNLKLMEARLEVRRGEVDLAFGTENPPSDYFGFGRGPGTQKILVGLDSREPVMGRPWYVRLISPFRIQEECEEGDDPDWRVSVRRSTGIQGRLLFEQEGQIPACTGRSCPEIRVEVPEDAESMELVLQSIEGDADLLVGIGAERESLVSLNPGIGFDVAVLDPEICIPLRGQSLPILLESWQKPTEYRLEVAYVPGEVEEEEEPPTP